MDFKHRYFDSVYGYIYLTEEEYKVTQTPVFQRLHFIRQLAFANLIFPSANHTRFSHSLGVTDILHKMVEQIRSSCPELINDEQHRHLRMAALLHDVGHLPLSHIGERATQAISNEISDREIFSSDDQGDGEGSTVPQFVGKLHESLSAEVIQSDGILVDLLKDFNVDLLCNIIVGGENSLYTQLLHSELDADRIDYLLRDANSTGVVYGLHDFSKIISHMQISTIEDESVVVFERKALLPIDHYLLSRYFMISQVIKNPKLILTDKLCQDVYEYMILNKLDKDDAVTILYDEHEFRKHIRNDDRHKLYDYNDNYFIVKMRLLHDCLDKIDKESGGLDEREKYINDSIKLLLSGQIPGHIYQKSIFVSKDSLDSTKKRWERTLDELFPT